MSSVFKVVFLLMAMSGVVFAIFLNNQSPKNRRKRKISGTMKLINNAAKEMAKMAVNAQ